MAWRVLFETTSLLRLYQAFRSIAYREHYREENVLTLRKDERVRRLASGGVQLLIRGPPTYLGIRQNSCLAFSYL